MCKQTSGRTNEHIPTQAVKTWTVFQAQLVIVTSRHKTKKIRKQPGGWTGVQVCARCIRQCHRLDRRGKQTSKSAGWPSALHLGPPPKKRKGGGRKLLIQDKTLPTARAVYSAYLWWCRSTSLTRTWYIYISAFSSRDKLEGRKASCKRATIQTIRASSSSLNLTSLARRERRNSL